MRPKTNKITINSWVKLKTKRNNQKQKKGMRSLSLLRARASIVLYWKKNYFNFFLFDKSNKSKTIETSMNYYHYIVNSLSITIISFQ
jgi:hypothetical protein